MIEVTTATPIYYFLMEFAKLVYAAFPIMVIFLGSDIMIQYLPPFEIVISIAVGFGIIAFWKFPWLMPMY